MAGQKSLPVAHARVEFATTLRGLAALAVVVSHYGVMFWANRPGVAGMINAPILPDTVVSPALLSWLYIPNFWWGSFGVGLFFIISGFVIPFALERLSATEFLIGRLFRIYPLYFAGFALTLVSIASMSWYFGNPWPFSASAILLHIPGLRDLLWYPPVDGIIWTLDIEVKFYLICALAAPLFARRSVWVLLIPFVLAAASWACTQAMPAWLNPVPDLYRLALGLTYASQYLIYMFIGVVFYLLHVKVISIAVALLAGAAVFGLFVATVASGNFANELPLLVNYAYAVGFFAFASKFPFLFRSTRVGDFLANISYPLYVVHGVTGYSLLRVLLDTGVQPWIGLLITTISAILLSWVLHVAIEVPSHIKGKQIAAMLANWRVKPLERSAAE